MCGTKFVIVVALGIIVATTTTDCAPRDVDVFSYLQKYEYLNTSNTHLSHGDSTVKEAIALFQEYYQLPGDGELNSATLSAMRKPRCGVRDVPRHYARNTIERKWPKTHLTWNFQFANKSTLQLTAHAFSLWAANSSLTFERQVLNPDILITYNAGLHTFVFMFRGMTCPDELDGPGGTLAHAYFPPYPNNSDAIAEIHIDSTEPWHVSMFQNPSDTIHLLYILTHEIGHALGLDHSSRADSVMYSYVNSYEKTYPVKLDIEDILAIQNLYGERKNDSSQETPATTPTVVPPKRRPKEMDLCELSYADNVLILDHRIFITFKQYAWMVDIDDQKYSKSLVLNDYMKFLPENVNITSAYQRPSGEVVLFAKDMIFMLEYPGFRLMPGWPKSIVSMNLPLDAVINAVINTNKGKTYVIFDEGNVAEIDECSMSVIRYHTLETIFSGIPTTIRSAFRYIDGNIYFLDRKQYYKFNEFMKSVIAAGNFDLTTLGIGIDCAKNGLLHKLQDLLNHLTRLTTSKLVSL